MEGRGQWSVDSELISLAQTDVHDGRGISDLLRESQKDSIFAIKTQRENLGADLGPLQRWTLEKE